MATNHSPYNLETSEGCSSCRTRAEGFFCSLSKPLVKTLEEVSFVTSYPTGAMLFVEGQAPRGVYVLCKGRAKLSVVSAEGKTLILKIAKPGEVLGLSSCLLSQPHEVTVETLSPCQVNFIRQQDFLRLMRESETCLRVAEQLSLQYQSACRELGWVGLSRSADWKVANLLLEMIDESQATGGQQGSFKLTLTHEEMSQMISTSRETVTRVLTRFRKAKLIEIHGATLVVRDPAGLRRIAGGHEPAEAPATRVVALPSASRSDSRLPGFARRERSGSSQLRVALAAD